MSLPISMKPADTTLHLILSRYRAAKRFPRASLEIPCLIDISNGTRTHFDITESKCNTRPPAPLDRAEVFPRFRALTSNWHTPETDETPATSLNSLLESLRVPFGT